MALFFTLVLALVAGTPGPDSTAIVANGENADSVDLAFYYALKRGIPENQICFLSGLPTAVDADLNMTEYFRLILNPLQSCLASRNGSLTVNRSQYTQDFGSPGSILSRTEAFVLMYGMPMRVKTQGNTISLQACLSSWFVSYPNKTLFVTTPVSSTSSDTFFQLNRPGQSYWEVNYNATGYLSSFGSYDTHGPWKIVTALNARTLPYAKYLVDQALLAESQGKAAVKNAQFVWMFAPNGNVRNYLDYEYTNVAAQMNAISGIKMINASFNTSWVAPTPIAGFICGTESMGTTIENNTYLPHCLVDDLTSFGAVPTNFKPSGQSQVSITRWNVKGCLGSHGTVSEPYTDAFPNRQFMVDYVLGNTMSEAYYRYIPTVLWMNYVVGDAMAAPFAVKPVLVVTLDSVVVSSGVQYSSVLTAFHNSSNLTAANYRSFGTTLSCNCCLVNVSVTPQTGKTILSLQVFVDGVLWPTNASLNSSSKVFSTSFSLPTLNKNASVLVVAQHNSTFREKVWLQRWIQVPAARTCGIKAGTAADTESPPSAATPASTELTATTSAASLVVVSWVLMSFVWLLQ